MRSRSSRTLGSPAQARLGPPRPRTDARRCRSTRGDPAPRRPPASRRSKARGMNTRDRTRGPRAPLPPRRTPPSPAPESWASVRAARSAARSAARASRSAPAARAARAADQPLSRKCRLISPMMFGVAYVVSSTPRLEMEPVDRLDQSNCADLD